ncbi:MAG TPA: OmpW family outer membrane protein [candidate division Zixibacteria bacterium]|nr:OmpW family outer membrane protein [candidate division Zixibacteria bacterium]
MNKALVIGCAFVLLLAGLSTAQDLTGKIAVSPFAGLGVPVGDMASDDFTDDDSNAAYRKMGFKFGASGEYFLSPNYSLGLSFRYASFGAKELEGWDPGDKINLLAFTLNGKYYFATEGTIRPYGVIGAGLASATFKDIVVDYETGLTVDFDAITKPCILFGIGGDYFASPNMSIFAEGSFDYYFSDGGKIKYDGEETGDELGTNYYFLDFVVGVRFWFGGATE